MFVAWQGSVFLCTQLLSVGTVEEIIVDMSLFILVYLIER